MSERQPTHPAEIEHALRRATHLECWTLFWLTLIILMMGLVAGGSKGFRTAWIEDMLSLLPPGLFLVSRWLEQRSGGAKFPFGFQRAGSLAFFFAAAALGLMGALLLYGGVKALILQEHPTVGSWTLAGREVWMGWAMIGALILSTIPPMILGHKKRKVGEKLHDKVLYTDADMNSADWQTGLAGALGVFGIALGWWWADSIAAALISLSILKDGMHGLRVSFGSLLDGAPRKLDSADIDPEVDQIRESLQKRYRDANVQIRESGRYVRINVEPDSQHHLPERLAEKLLEKDSWRLLEMSVAVRRHLPEDHDDADPCI